MSSMDTRSVQDLTVPTAHHGGVALRRGSRRAL